MKQDDALPMPACGAPFHEDEGVFCQLEKNHMGEHWSRFREESDPENYVRGELSWKNAEDLKQR